MNCHRGVRTPLNLKWGTHVSSRVATGELGLLSSGRWELVPLELHWETQDSSQFAAGNSKLLSNCSRNSVFSSRCSVGLRVTLKPQRGNSGFLSICDRDLKGPLELLHVNQNLELRWGTWVYFKVAAGNLGSSRVVLVISVFLLSCHRVVGLL